jgi:subtilisin family serine protease
MVLLRLFFLTIAVTCLVLGLSPAYAGAESLSAALVRRSHVEGELLVKYRQGVSEGERKALHYRHSLRELRRFRHLGVHHLKLPHGADMAAFMEKLKKDRNVEYVEPNYKRKPMGTVPNDPAWAEQWGLTRIGLPEVWSAVQGSRAVIVAVLDTGVDYTHQDLAPNIWTNQAETAGNNSDDDGNGYVDDVTGWNFYSNTNDPMDFDGHGTHVSGIIGAVGNNGFGVAGVNWRVKVIPLKFMEEDGSIASEIDAIEYAVDNGAKIINASYGDPSFSQSEYDAIREAGLKGVLFVAAAGNESTDNDGTTRNYPSSYDLPNIISVAASDSQDSLASFSNYGAVSVHLAAPGVNILSTVPQNVSSASGATLQVNAVQYRANGMEFAALLPSEGLTGTLYDCGYGASAGDFPAGVRGNIALIKRGAAEGPVITFAQKVTNAQNAGAVAVIIYNNVAGSFNGTLGSAGNWIPTVGISMEDGQPILALGNVPATLRRYAYATYNGTSMATPFVSGVAALLWAERPDATMAQIKDAILQSVDLIPEMRGRIATGGRLNAYKGLVAIAHTASYRVTLKPGWNFVSFPKLPSASAPIGEVFRDVAAQVIIVWSFDNQKKEWAVWRPSAASPTLLTVEAGKGYWVFMNGEGAISMADWLTGATSAPLFEGWNLVGYGGINGEKVANGMSGASDTWNMIWSWENGEWYAVHKTITPLPVPPLTTFAISRAYWIQIRAPQRQLEWFQ